MPRLTDAQGSSRGLKKRPTEAQNWAYRDRAFLKDPTYRALRKRHKQLEDKLRRYGRD